MNEMKRIKHDNDIKDAIRFLKKDSHDYFEEKDYEIDDYTVLPNKKIPSGKEISSGKLIVFHQVLGLGTIYFSAGLILKWFADKLGDGVWIAGIIIGIINLIIFYYNLKSPKEEENHIKKRRHMKGGNLNLNGRYNNTS